MSSVTVAWPWARRWTIRRRFTSASALWIGAARELVGLVDDGGDGRADVSGGGGRSDSLRAERADDDRRINARSVRYALMYRALRYSMIRSAMDWP